VELGAVVAQGQLAGLHYRGSALCTKIRKAIEALVYFAYKLVPFFLMLYRERG